MFRMFRPMFRRMIDLIAMAFDEPTVLSYRPER